MIDKKFDTAVIFAGGRSSRMGRDKALLPFGGYSSLSEYQYIKLSKIFKKVYISSKSNKFNFGVDIVEDCYSISSPLVALVSIFKRLDIDEVFVLSVDAPFVDRDVIEKLYRERELSKDAIVALSLNGVEPLCAIYRKSILPKAERFLEEDNHRLNSLIRSLDTKFVEFISNDHFINLNTPKEYQEATRKS